MRVHVTKLQRLIALTLLPASALFAQSLAGTWQGIVRSPDNGADLRTVLKIAASGDDTIKGNFYSIDQTYMAFPITATLQGSAVKLKIPGIGAVYEAKLSADRNTMAGMIKEGFPAPVPWTLRRVSDEQAWAIPPPPAPAKPMANPDPVFEVAAIKLSQPDAKGRGLRIQGGKFSAFNMTLADLMTYAYDVHAHQLIGAPAWVSMERYEITAKQEGEGQPSEDQWRVMLRKLLADRFQLAFHRDQQELPVYTITVAKGGPKISKSLTKGETPFLVFPRPGNLASNNVSMADFCKLFQRGFLDRPVVDQTGLPGRYDFTLVWTPDQLRAAAPNPNALVPAAADPAPDLFTATQQQLGLKIDATKLRIEVLVIDKAEKPSDN